MFLQQDAKEFAEDSLTSTTRATALCWELLHSCAVYGLPIQASSEQSATLGFSELTVNKQLSLQCLILLTATKENYKKKKPRPATEPRGSLCSYGLAGLAAVCHQPLQWACSKMLCHWWGQKKTFSRLLRMNPGNRY